MTKVNRAHRPTRAALLGILLMAGSLFLPVLVEYVGDWGPGEWGPYYIFVFDPLGLGITIYEPLRLAGPAIVVLVSGLTTRRRPRVMWLCLAAWLAWWIYIFVLIRPVIAADDEPRSYSPLWPWITALAGALTVLGDSLRSRLAAKVDPAVFD